jgi:hypothetical protein
MDSSVSGIKPDLQQTTHKEIFPERHLHVTVVW